MKFLKGSTPAHRLIVLLVSRVGALTSCVSKGTIKVGNIFTRMENLMKLSTASFAILLGLVNISLASATEITCAGTEPFWGITSSEKELTFFTPDAPENAQTFKIVSVSKDATVIKTEYTTLTLNADVECSDGMSERTYTHSAAYDIAGKTLYGCCTLK